MLMGPRTLHDQGRCNAAVEKKVKVAALLKGFQEVSLLAGLGELYH